jgi:Kef-type K+ transport system membrane component KefB
MDAELRLIALVALLYFLPKIVLRLGVPSPVTEMLLGVACGPLLLGLVEVGELLAGLAGLGISALFLFAGLEVEVEELVERRQTLFQHLAIQLLLFAANAGIGLVLGADLSTAALLAVAILSPSAGFILPALDALGLSAAAASWIKHKAVATEIAAILVVLVFSKTASAQELLVGLGGVIALVVAVPLLFLAFHRTRLRWAPRTEFRFVMIVALLAGYASHRLGMHYLVGAFLVGLVARRYLDHLARRGVGAPSLRLALGSFRFLSTFFVPFYFFVVGLQLPAGALSVHALGLAAGLGAVAVPLRVGLLLGPTLVFTLAVAELLHDRYGIADWVFGGLVLYGAGTSFLPVLTHSHRSTEYEDLMETGQTGIDPEQERAR